MVNYATYQGFLDPEADDSVLLSRYHKPLTAALFIERADIWKDPSKEEESEHQSLYTLDERGKEGLPSAYQIYMHSSDEYEAAMKIVGSLYHWSALMEKPWFMERLVEWRKHMALRDYSVAKRVVLKDAKNGDGPAARKIMDSANKVLNPAPVKKIKGKEAKSLEVEEQSFDELFDKHIGK